MKSIAYLFSLSLIWTNSAHGKVRVAIIGAGVAGAKTAALLADEDIDLHVYEASERVGGRALGRSVTLSNGTMTTVNAGTQMNFAQFFQIAPELRKARDLFFSPHQKITVTAPSVIDGNIKTIGIERADNPYDPDRAMAITENIIRGELLTPLDAGLSGMTAFFLKTEEMDSLPFDNLETMYEAHPEWDKMTAEDFINNLRYTLYPHTGWGNLWSAWRLWSDYQATPPGPQKVRLGADILENGLYYGWLMANGLPTPIPAQRDAYFTENYIKNIVQSMESLVEFTDLKSMSALNFIWQLKWVTSGGKFIVARTWDRVPEIYMKQNANAQLHLQSPVTSIREGVSHRWELSIQTPEGLRTEGYDVVINTADSDTALAMSQFDSPELQDLLKFNTYTSTVALHIEMQQTADEIFDVDAGAALVAAPGLMQSLGGITFHTQLLGQDLGGLEIAGLFARSPVARAIIEKAKQNQWTEQRLGEEMKSLFVNDLTNLASASANSAMTQLAKLVRNGRILAVTQWEKALPHFASGHMQKVARYRQRLGRSAYFYVGQAVYGRSIVMVLAGINRDIALIKKAIHQAQH